MKKVTFLTLLLALVLALGSLCTVQADLIPPQGMGQIGIGAIVLMNGMPVYEKPDDASKVMETLETGSHIILLSQDDGWAECTLSDAVDAGPAGWVKTEYLLVDNAWYLTEATVTPVYAWNDTEAPIIDLLDEYTLVPVLKEDGDWLVISLRGATAWILR